MNITINPNVVGITPEYRQRLSDLYDVRQRLSWLRCGMRILVVADNFLSFDDRDFGLSRFIDGLKARSRNSAPVTVTTAHRGNPTASRLNGATPNFTFDYDTLKQYDQVWIFAADYPSRSVQQGNTPASPISDDERQAIRQFMDEGGGVFATGDHEDLGVTVGGYIPRVRSMRRWFFGVPNPSPQGEPNAPDGADTTRHDTNREGHDPGFSFADQSDDVPQQIIPKMYTTGRHSFIRNTVIQRPHPVLCGPNGTIRVLPDHAHEGECEVPGNLDATYSIGSDTFDEYPKDRDGNRVTPEVIADATILAGATASGKPPVPAGRFGVIGAYDGHRAGVGRIVVDATWHHFININLVGDRDFGLPDPSVPKSMGFLHTTEGQEHLANIEHYFFNIAKWLSPGAFRFCLIQRHLWEYVHSGQFAQRTNLSDQLQTGAAIREHLYLRLGKCETLAIVWERLRDLTLIEQSPLDVLDPFNPTPRPQPDPVPFDLQAEVIVDHVLGATAMNMVSLSDGNPERFLEKNADKLGRVDAFDRAFDAGIADGMNALSHNLEDSAKRQLEMAKQMKSIKRTSQAA
ncbi:MAG: hypothetical protein AAF004_05420 [Pseudomonadota bacterium]